MATQELGTFGERIRAGVESRMPNAYGPASDPNAVAGGQTQQPGIKQQLWEQWDKAGSVEPEELLTTADYYKTANFTPRIAQQKGATKMSVEANQAAFDARVDKWIPEFIAWKNGKGPKPQGDAPVADPGEMSIGEMAIRPVQSLLEGVGNAATAAPGLLGGILGGADIVGRALYKRASDALTDYDGQQERDRAQQKEMFDLLGKGEFKKALNSALDFGLEGTEQSAVGDAGQHLLTGQQMMRDAFTTDRTKFAQQTQPSLSDGFSAWLGHAIANPSVIPPMIGDMLGMAGGGSTVANLTTRGVTKQALASGSKKAMEQVAKLQGAQSLGISGIGYAGQSALNFHETVENMSKEELDALKKTGAYADAWQVLEVAGQETGVPPATLDKQFRDLVANRGSAAAFATSLAANVALPAVVSRNLRPESIIARNLSGLPGARAGGRAGNALRVGAAQFPEEYGAGAIEQIGQNIGAGEDDYTKGAGTAGLIEGTVGGAFGGAVGAMERPKNPLQKPTPKPTATPNAAAPTTPPSTPPGGAAPAAGTTAQTAPNIMTALSINAAPGAGVDDAAVTTATNAMKNAVSLRMATPAKRKAVQTLFGKMDSEGVADYMTGIAAASAGASWDTMTPLQRMELVEAVRQEMLPVLPEGAANSPMPHLQTIRDAITAGAAAATSAQAPATATATATPAPGAAPAAPQAAPTPTPAPTPAAPAPPAAEAAPEAPTPPIATPPAPVSTAQDIGSVVPRRDVPAPPAGAAGSEVPRRNPLRPQAAALSPLGRTTASRNPLQAQPAQPAAEVQQAQVETPAGEATVTQVETPQAEATTFELPETEMPDIPDPEKPTYNGRRIEFASDLQKAAYMVNIAALPEERRAQLLDWLNANNVPSTEVQHAANIINTYSQFQEDMGGGGPITIEADATPGIPATKAKMPKKGNALQKPAAPAAEPETPAPTTPLKRGRGRPRKNPLQEKAPSPKADAPVEQPGQIEEETAPEEEATVPDTWTGRAIASADATSLFPAGELEALMETAAEGGVAEFSDLNKYLQEAIKEEVITREQAAAIRQAVTAERTRIDTAQRAEATRETDEEVDEDEEAFTLEGDDGDVDMLGGGAPPGVRSADTQAAIDSVPVDKDGKRSAADVLQAILDNVTMAPVLRQLGKLMVEPLRKFNVRFDTKHVEGAYGGYARGTNTISMDSANPTVFLHEAVHAITVRALVGRSPINKEITALQDELQELFEHVRKEMQGKFRPLVSMLDAMPEVGGRATANTGWVGNVQEMLAYGATDTYFAGVLNQIAATRPKAGLIQTAWDQLKNIWARTFAAVTNRPLTKPEYTALDQLLDLIYKLSALPNSVHESQMNLAGAGNIWPATVMRQALDNSPASTSPFNALDPMMSFTSLKQKDTRQLISKLAAGVWETAANSRIGLEQAVWAANEASGEVNQDNNPVLAAFRLTSDIAEMRTLDLETYVTPLINWINTNFSRFGSDFAEVYHNLDQFFQANHLKHERDPSVWADTVALSSPAAEAQRDLLRDQAEAGQITDKQLDQMQIALAQKYAKQTLENWRRKNSRDPDEVDAILDDLQQKGYTRQSVADLQALLKPIRDRTQQHYREAGITSDNDPYANRGWEWYVPLRGAADKSYAQLTRDLGPRKWNKKQFRERGFKTIDGRTTEAENSLESLIMSLNEAATANAEARFRQRVADFLLDNAKLFGLQTRTWEGTDKQGWTTSQKKTPSGRVINSKKEYTVGKIKEPTNGFILFNGDKRIEFLLPEGTPILRGIQGATGANAAGIKFEESYPIVKKVLDTFGSITGVMARFMTTWNPTWVAMVSFMRDANGIPLTIAAEHFGNPVEAAPFMRRYYSNLASNMLRLDNVFGAMAEVKQIFGNRLIAKDYAKTHPGSFLDWAQQYRDAGGSTYYAQSLNRDAARELLTQGSPLNKGLWEKTKSAANKLDTIFGDFAQMLELRARVAAFKALMEMSANNIPVKGEIMTPETAAAYVKSVLDFSQSGTWGRYLNLLHAFYRVSATGVDVMRRVFTTDKGEVDWNKLAVWGPTIAGIGAIQYMMAAAIMGDDEDKKSRISKYGADTLSQNTLLAYGPTDEDVFKIPHAQGLMQVFMSMGTIAAAVSMGNMTPNDAQGALENVVQRNLSPIQPFGRERDGGVANFIHSYWRGAKTFTAERPWEEIENNLNAFGNPVHTQWVDKKKPNFVQGMPTTPQTFKDFAAWVYANTGYDAFPEDYAHIFKGYGGQLARLAVYYIGGGKEMKESVGEETRDVRVATSTAIQDTDFYYRREARRVLDVAAQANKRMLAAVPEDATDNDKARWMRQNREDGRRIAAGKGLEAAYKAYNKALDEIRAGERLSPEQRKARRRRADRALRVATEKAERAM